MTKDMKSSTGDIEGAVVSLDGLVDSVSGCGLFQVLLVMATYSTQLVAGWSMFFMAFGNYNPGWHCADAARGLQEHLLPTNHTGLQQLHVDLNNQTDPYEDQFQRAAGDKMYNNGTDTDLCDLFERCANVQFDPSASTIVTEWTLICGHRWVQAVIISVQMVGVFLGSLLGGYAGDRYGRKLTLYGSLAGCGLFNLLAVFVGTWQMFAAVRFCLGICVAGILATSFLYPMEFMNEWGRGLVGALPIWNLGAATFSVVVLVLKDWRHVHLTAAVVSILIFLPVFWVPESLRWLAVHGKVEEAKQITYRLSRTNRRPLPDTAILESLASTEEKITAVGNRVHQHSFLDLFRTRSVRTTSLVMGFVWVCVAMIYYAISFGIKALSGDFYINFLIFSVAEIPGMIFVAPAANKLGRRLASHAYMIFITIACFSVIVVSFVAPDDIRGTVITVLALLAKVHVVALWAVITVYCSELYPTVVRNISCGYLNSVARVGGIIAPYLIPSSPDLMYISFLIMGIVLIVCCLLLLLLPETKGRDLEDVLRPD